MKVLDIIVTVLLVIGAFNWGLVGFLGYNPVEAIFGDVTAFIRVFYVAVGLSGLYEAYNFTVGYNELHHRWCDFSTSGSH